MKNMLKHTSIFPFIILLHAFSTVAMNNEQLAQLLVAINLALQHKPMRKADDANLAKYNTRSHKLERERQTKHANRNPGKGKFKKENR